MPFSSKSQQRFMFAKKPEVARRWVKEQKEDSFKPLPEKKKGKFKNLQKYMKKENY